MRIRSRLRPETDYHCGMSFLQLLDLVAVPTDELGDLASVRACPQCLPAEWHLLLGSCRDHELLGVTEVFGLIPGNMRYNCICKYMSEALSNTCRIARLVFHGI